MNNNAKNSLREIGLLLDKDIYPRVYNGGVVKPDDTAIELLTSGEGINNVNERKRRSTTGSRKGATTGQGSTSRPWPSGSSSPLLYSSLRERYEAEIESVGVAYPKATIWKHEKGMWLLTESLILEGLGKKATFLIYIPYSQNLMQKSWGFWTTPISLSWIGPRHTNFPDGSICAFDPHDNTWCIGDSVVDLVDIYSLWALRHQHLYVFNRWPGLQSVPYPYERLTELKDNESCGCNKSTNTYIDCCKASDMGIKRINSAMDFLQFTRGAVDRKPPQLITKIVRDRIEPPTRLENLYL